MSRLAFLLPLLLALSAPLGAESFSGWQRTSTKHFVFVYEKRDRAVVAELRSFAEQVYSEVTRSFGSYPKRIWVVVDGRVDTANGYYTGGIFPSHLVLYVTSPSVPILGSQERQYLRLLLTHELTHYVHLNFDRGFFAVLSDVFGPGMKPADSFFLPDWMKEGIAVNNETRFTTGGRGRDPFFEMKYRALVLDNHFFSLRQAAFGSAFPPRDRVYVGGYLIVHYLLEHYGANAFAEIQRRFARFPFFGPWAAIKAVTGVSADALFHDMVQELRRRYARYSSIPAGRLLSPDRIGDYELPVITDRGWYEYRSNLDSAPAIVRVQPTTGAEQVLVDTSLTDYTSLTADRSGDKIAYASFDVTLGPAGTSATSDLFALDPLTHRLRRITSGKHLWQPALSPNGKRLVAVQRHESFSRLVLVDQRDGTVRPLFYRKETNVYNPSFSPDGRLLTFALNDHGRQEIMVLDLRRALASPPPRRGSSASANVNGALARSLPVALGTNAFFPRFSGADHVTFIADLGNGLALYEEALTDGKLYRIADDPVGVSDALVDGRRVIYTSYSNNGTVLREKPVGHVEVSPTPGAARGAAALVPPAPDASAPTTAEGPGAAGERAESLPQGRRYVDWPRPLLWFPLPFYDYLPANATSLHSGFGAFLYGASVLERNSFSLGLSLRTDILQPSISLAVSSMIGTSTLNYSLSEGYSGVSPAAYEQSLAQSLGLTIPLIAENITGTTTTFSATPGISDTLSIQNSRPFTVAAPFESPSAFSFTNTASLDLGLAYTRVRDSPPRDIYSPHRLDLSLQGHYTPAFLGAEVLSSTFTGTVTLPSFFRHQVVRLGVKTSYSTAPFAGPVPTTIRPRGLFVPFASPGDPVYEQSTPARSIAAADYLFNIALLDRPLPLGFNIQGLAAGLHLAAAADWNPQNGLFEPDPSLYAGAEIIALVGYQAGGAALPIGFGVTVRFDPTFSRPFNPLHDIGPYVFFGTDSFTSPALTASASIAQTARQEMLSSRRVDF